MHKSDKEVTEKEKMGQRRDKKSQNGNIKRNQRRKKKWGESHYRSD